MKRRTNVLKLIQQKGDNMITSKKQRFIATKNMMDPETGEIIPAQLMSVEERDFNFHKLWLQHLVNDWDDISNQKLRLAYWIVEHLDSENKLTMTQRTIAEKSGISLNTVSKTMTSLQEGKNGQLPFLIKINSGAYQVNPSVLWHGSHNRRMAVIYDYSIRDAEATEKRAKAVETKATEEDDHE